VLVDITRVRELADAIAAGEKARVNAVAERLGLRVEWYGSHFRLRRGVRSVACRLGMPREQLETPMRVLFGRVWSIASR
jgi:hypothetical protein